MSATVHIAPALIGDSTSASLTPVGAGASSLLGSAPSAADAAWNGCLNDLERMVVALFHENARLRRCALSRTSSEPVAVHDEDRIATPPLAASAVSATRTSTRTPSHDASSADHDDLESNASFVFLTEHEGRGSPLLATDTERDTAAADAGAAARNRECNEDDDDDVAPEVDALREENQLLKAQLRAAQEQLAVLATASRRLREVIAQAVSGSRDALDTVGPSPHDAAGKASSDLDATESVLVTLVDERDQLKRKCAHGQETIQALRDQIRVLEQQQRAPPVAAVASGNGSQDDVYSASETTATTPLSPRRSLLNRFHVELPQGTASADALTGATTPRSPRQQGSAAIGTKTPPSYTIASTSRSATPPSFSENDLLRFLLPESCSHTPTTASPGASPAKATLTRGGPPGTPPSRPFTPPAALPSSLLF